MRQRGPTVRHLSEGEEWLQQLIESTPQRLPGHRPSSPSIFSQSVTTFSSTPTQRHQRRTSSLNNNINRNSNSNKSNGIRKMTPPISLFPPTHPLTTPTKSSTQNNNNNNNNNSDRRNGRRVSSANTSINSNNNSSSSRQSTPARRGWVESRLDELLKSETSPIAKSLRRREINFEETMREWAAWREREKQSMREFENDLRRRAERITRQEISLIAREAALHRGEIALKLQKAELHRNEERRRHLNKTDEVLASRGAKGRMQTMESEMQQLKSIVKELQHGNISSETPQQPQQNSVGGGSSCISNISSNNNNNSQTKNVNDTLELKERVVQHQQKERAPVTHPSSFIS